MTAEPSDAIVRPIVASDFARWLSLWDGYNAFYGRAGLSALPAEITWATWLRFLDPGEPVHALVAEVRGELVGLAHYLFHRSTIRIELTCYLQDLYTAASDRGQGVGPALIGAVAERARAVGTTRLYWHTHESNHTARRLYDAVAERSGFIVYRREL
ncbi:MAG TPA: GNAT family N-acetyltransferase [Steroidobacteraceae bacterium]